MTATFPEEVMGTLVYLMGKDMAAFVPPIDFCGRKDTVNKPISGNSIYSTDSNVLFD